jgi:putative membrane protein
MATTPSESASEQSPPPSGAAPEDADRRLHPFSWLFVLINQLRPMLYPVLLLLFLGRGEQWELFGILGAVGLSLYSLVYSFSFRYRIGHDSLVVREGIFSRTERHIPFARIQNIVQKRNLLHRLFAVTELRLESAGGARPEAVMSVISASEARLLERLLHGRSAAGDDATDNVNSTTLLHAANLAEVIRYGLCSNRGAVLVGAAFAAGWQFQFWESSQFGEAMRWAFGSSGAASGFGGWLGMLLTALIVALTMTIVLKLLSVLMCLLSHHGFRLDLEGGRIGTRAGLLTRRHASANLTKLQRVLLSQSWLARRMGRLGLKCEVASGSYSDSQSSKISTLVPLGTAEQVAAVLGKIAPELNPDYLHWLPLDPQAWRRRLWPSAINVSLLALPASWFLGPWVAAAWLLLLTLLTLEARGWARHAAYACSDRVFAFRAGWLTRRWTIALIGKGQAVLLKQSPFDRRHRLASVRLDTAGVSPTSFAMQVPYLSTDQAQALFDATSRAIAGGQSAGR